MQTLNTHEFPNGGWQFRQSQTGWSAPTPIASTHDQTVILIIRHRMANPAIVAKHKLSTDPKVVSEELLKFNRLRLGIPEPAAGSPGFFSPGRSLSKDVLDAAANLRRAAQGTAVVLDWLGAGGNPVSQETAEERAAVCVACPLNQPAAWYTQAPAEILRSAVTAWQTLKGSAFAFETSQGDKLKSCSACKCLLRLKVFVDAKHILEKTKPEVFNDLDPKCWILAERKAAEALT